MRFFKSATAFALIALLLFSFGMVAYADDDGAEKLTRMNYIISHSSSITHGTLSSTMKAEAKGNSQVTKIKIKMELQKESGGSYTTVQTWEETFNSRTASKTVSKATSPFSTYRLKTTITAYAGSNTETIYLYAY